MTRNLTYLGITIVVLGVLASPVSGQIRSLSGERLESTSGSGAYTCVGNQVSGSFTFSGTATGPYPGTFTEQVTLSPHPSLAGVSTFTGVFTIVSGSTTISGNKLQITFGCDPTASHFFGHFTGGGYNAVITSPDGVLQDFGNTFIDLRVSNIFPEDNRLGETFKSVAPGTPVFLELSPVTDTNPVSTTHIVTATVRDFQTNPVAGTEVTFEVAGSVTVDGSCTTNTNGQCDFSYNGPSVPGADSILAFIDFDGDGMYGPDDFFEPAALATKVWIFTTPPEGSVTGGGQAGAPAITFGFNARTDPKISGNCTVIDQSTDPHTIIKCTTVTSVTVIQAPTGGGTAHIDATGTINTGTTNEVQTNIQIDVVDVSEPNRGADEFKISTTSGYIGGGPVIYGNIQVHR